MPPQNALQIGLGLNWKDTRIKIMGDSLVVEFRPISTQKTPEENFAAMMFYLGRLLWSQNNQEDLLPIELVKINREEAMYKGLNGKLWIHTDTGIERFDTRDIICKEIDKASQGLEHYDLFDDTMLYAYEILYRKASNLNSGDIIKKMRQDNLQRDMNSRNALGQAMKHIKAIHTK